MDDTARWLKEREACGLTNKVSDRALRAFEGMLGSQYYALTVASYERLRMRRDNKGGEPVWRCRCACGGEVTARQQFLRDGAVKNCGKCQQATPPAWSELLLRKLALTLELEGSIGAYSTGPRVVVSVRDYSKELVRKLCAEVGVGEVTLATTLGKPIAQWQVSGGSALAVLGAVLPFLVCKREQAVLVLAYPRGERGVRVTPEMRAERERIVAAVHVLNVKGSKSPKPEWRSSAQEWMKWAAAADQDARMEILALALEWEGHLGVYERKCAGSPYGVTHQVVIGMGQSAHRVCLLEIAQALAGGVGTITGVRVDSRTANAPTRSWQVNAVAAAKRLAADLVPFMQCKKRLAEIITEYPEWNEAPSPVPQLSFAARRGLAVGSKAANGTEPEEGEE